MMADAAKLDICLCLLAYMHVECLHRLHDTFLHTLLKSDVHLGLLNVEIS